MIYLNNKKYEEVEYKKNINNPTENIILRKRKEP